MLHSAMSLISGLTISQPFKSQSDERQHRLGIEMVSRLPGTIHCHTTKFTEGGTSNVYRGRDIQPCSMVTLNKVELRTRRMLKHPPKERRRAW